LKYRGKAALERRVKCKKIAPDLNGNLIRVFYDFRGDTQKERHIAQRRLAFIDFPALRANQTLKIPSG